MTFREHLHGVAVTTGELLATGQDGVDVDVALTAHAGFVRLLRTVNADTTGLGTPGEPRTLTALQRHPVAVFTKLLTRQPDHPTLALTDVLARTPASAATALWSDLARDTALALEEWQAVPPRSRPTGDEAWSDVGDVAALGEALAHVNHDLAVQLDRAGQPRLGQEFAEAAHSGLATAAREVRLLAASGPQPQASELARPSSAVVLRVRRDADIPFALARLSMLLRATSELSPAHAQLVARVLAGSSLAAARTLRQVGDVNHGRLAGALEAQATALADVASAPRRAAALAPSDPRSLAQAQQIHDRLTITASTGHPLTEAHSLAAASAGAAATKALASAVDRQVFSGRWVIPVEGADAAAPQWGRVSEKVPLPQLVTTAQAAALQAGGVLAVRPLDRPVPSRWPAPREVLATALARRAATEHVRPPHPSAPVRLAR